MIEVFYVTSACVVMGHYMTRFYYNSIDNDLLKDVGFFYIFISMLAPTLLVGVLWPLYAVGFIVFDIVGVGRE